MDEPRKKNLIELPILGIKFESDTYIFRNDGLVENVHEHGAEIYEEFGDSREAYYAQNVWGHELEPAYGLTQVPPNQVPPITIISFYQRCESHLKEVFVRGHEETHVLQHAKRIDLFKEILSSLELYADIELHQDKEIIANIGGLYAVIKNKFDSSLISSFLKGMKIDNKRKMVVLEIYNKFLDSQKGNLYAKEENAHK